MMKSATTIKKFQFFDIESEQNSGESQNNPNYLRDISPNQMYAINQIIFLSAKVKRKVDNLLTNENLILKIVKNKVVDQYKVFNKTTEGFHLKYFNSKYYFVMCGGEMIEKAGAGNDKMMHFLTSIKIFDISTLLDRNHVTQDRNIDSLMVKQIILARNVENGQFYLGKDFPKNVESLQLIISFAISDDFSCAAISIEEGQIILVQV